LEIGWRDEPECRPPAHSPARPISKDAGLGVAETYVSERYTGTQAEASSAAVNAKTVPPIGPVSWSLQS